MTAAPPFRSLASLGQPLPPRRVPPRPAPESPLHCAARVALNADLARIIRRQAVGNWMLPSLAAVTPQYIEGILRGALGGDPLQTWNLFDLIEDTWPRLLKDLNELKGAVTGMNWKLNAWAEEDQAPSPDAVERKKVISDALWRMNPAPDADDNGFEQTIFDILDAHAKGLSVLEIIWEQRRVGQFGDLTVPNCTCWVHPRYYGWSNEGFLGLNPTERGAVIERFPERKFIVALCKAKSGPTGTSARLRALAWWWCAANFSGDWLMNLAQLFGIPFRWATFANGASDDTITAIGAMMTNMGSSGHGEFPEGTNLQFLEAGKNAGSSPQADLLERADKNCDLLILGQTLTSDVGASGAGGGSLALGKVHAGVREQFIQAAANFAARVINQQLIPAILLENYGDADEAPYFTPEPETQKDLTATATMIKTAVETGFKVPAKWAHAELNIPLPQAGEEIIEKAAPATPSPVPGSNGKNGRDSIVFDPEKDIVAQRMLWRDQIKKAAEAAIEEQSLAASAAETDGKWVTINGTPVFIKEGQSVVEAAAERFGKKDTDKNLISTPEKSKLKEPNERENRSPSTDSPKSPGTSAQYVGRGRESAPGHDESRSERHERFRAEEGRLRDWAEESGKLGGKLPPADDRGGEHNVHFDEKTQRYQKSTYWNPEVGNGYGYAAGSYVKGSTPAEYLDRLETHNKLFNDDVRVERIVPVNVGAGGPRYSIVTSQPAIKGTPAPVADIDSMMAGKGFKKIGAYAYHSASRGLLVYDMAPKNVLKTANGRINPIDPIIQRVKPDFVKDLIHSPAFRGSAARLPAAGSSVATDADKSALTARQGNFKAENNSTVPNSSVQSFVAGVAADLRPFLARTNMRLDAILSISDPALREQKLDALWDELEPLRQDILKDPESARVLERLSVRSMAGGLSSRGNQTR